jgi:hypothetical protein
MAVVKIYKETILPANVEANSIYLVAPAEYPSHVEMYVTDSAGSEAKRVINRADIQAMIDASIAGVAGLEIVDNIAARDAIINPTNGKHVLVIDATDDPTVDAGGASYVWRASTSEWIKLTEYESLDMSFTWSSLVGGPSSTPAQIDAAVANNHTHANKTELDAISVDAEGNLMYNSNHIRARLETVGW